MSSDTDIANLALARIGAARINSMDDATVPAQQCKLFYAQDRDALLRGHSWVFAMTRAQLSEDADTPAFGYGHAYILPSDCLRVVRLYHGHRQYQVEGKRILTDDTECRIIYIRRIEDPAQFDALFVRALALELALSIESSLAQDKGLYQLIQADLNTAIAAARLADVIESETEEPSLSWAQARFINIHGRNR
jgi:hypothetical protein